MIAGLLERVPLHGYLLGKALLYAVVGYAATQLLVMGLLFLLDPQVPLSELSHFVTPQFVKGHPYLFLFFLGLSTAGTFLFPAWACSERPMGEIFAFERTDVMSFLMVPPIVLFFMSLNAWAIWLNQSLELPEAWAAVEAWARASEQRVQSLLDPLLGMEGGLAQFLVVGLVIGLLAGISEEWFFRGLLQPLFLRMTHHREFAIWLSAFLFALFHFQFYGFLPRMLLGALFGYLFHFSQRLWIPILAHSFNNLFLLSLYYLRSLGFLTRDLFSDFAGIKPSLGWSVVGGLCLTGLLYLFVRRVKGHAFGLEKGCSGA